MSSALALSAALSAAFAQTPPASPPSLPRPPLPSSAAPAASAVPAATAAARSPAPAASAPRPTPPAAAASAPAAPNSGQRIEITGGRNTDTEERRRATASKIVIGREEIDKFGDATVGEVLRRLPGVTTPGAPGRGGPPRMRGLGGGFTQLLIDGQRMAPGFSLESLTPEQVERIALYDAWVYDEQLPSMFHMARAKGVGEVLFGLFYSERADERLTLGFYDPDMVTQHLADEVEKAFERPGTRAGALEAVRGMRFEELEPRYKTITAPTLLLWGREDLVTPVSVGEKLVRQLPNAKLKVYARCGHFPMIEAISESNRDLSAFLGAGAP